MELSPELRDLLDKIFVADEFKRITIQAGGQMLRGHFVCWYGARGEGMDEGG